jgi:hypothetical protein
MIDQKLDHLAKEVREVHAAVDQSHKVLLLPIKEQ